MGIVVFNGISTLDYDITVEQPPNYTGAKRDYESKHIPGRNGDLILDSGSYQNVNREYNLAVGSEQKSFAQLSNILSKWVYSGTGYARLEDSYDPDVYRMAIYNNELQVTNVLNHIARATVSFNCMPQRWLKSGEVAHKFYSDYSEEGNNKYVRLANPSSQPAKPLIKIKMCNVGTYNPSPSRPELIYFGDLYVENYTFDGNSDYSHNYVFRMFIPKSYIQNGTIQDGNYVIIDCEQMTTFVQTNTIKININPYCEFIYNYDTNPHNFIRLSEGVNRVKILGDTGPDKFEEAEVIPRWWTI